MKSKTLAVSLLGALLLGACVQAPDLSTVDEHQNDEQAVGTEVPASKLNLRLPVAGEETVWVSSQYKGKPVLIAFMATWCPWCKRSLPALDQTSISYKDKVEVVGVFVENDIAPVNQVIKDFNIQSKILYNGGSVAQDLGVNGFPHIMLFDEDHRLVRVWSGYSDTLGYEYAKEIDKLLQ